MTQIALHVTSQIVVCVQFKKAHCCGEYAEGMMGKQHGFGAAGEFGSPGRTVSGQDALPAHIRPDQVPT